MAIQVITDLETIPHGYGNIIYGDEHGRHFIDPLSPRALLMFLAQFPSVRIELGNYGEHDVIRILEAEYAVHGD